MKTFFIYELKDPLTMETRYIGITNNPKKRFNLHIWEAKNNKNKSYKSNWIKSLLKKNKTPLMAIVAEGLSSKLCKKLEVALIKYYRNKGVKLTNLTNGGDGANGYIHSEEVKKKLSENRIGSKHPLYGKLVSEEVRKKISEANMGKKQPWAGIKRSKEFLKYLSDRNKGSNNPMYGKKFSVESIQKRSNSRRMSTKIEKFYCA